MAPSSTSSNTGLDEVVTAIRSATERVHKDKNNVVYSAVSSKSLHGWIVKIETAMKQLAKGDELESSLVAAKDQAAELLEAAARKELKITELEGILAANQKAHTEFKAAKEKEIKTAQAALDESARKCAEARKDLSASQEALLAAERQLKAPAAKFSPEEAKRLQGEVRMLRSDIAAATDNLASEKAETSRLNKAVDSLRKAVAAKALAEREASDELANFRRQMSAANALNVELFDKEDLSLADLRLAFGARAVEKLQLVLDTGAWDVRKRISKLQGFFQVAARAVDSGYKQYLTVLAEAFYAMKTASTKWVAVIGPWVNLLVKDLVFMNLRPMIFYKADLEAKMAAVKVLPPSATAMEKYHAVARATPSKGWRERAKDTRDRAKNLGERIQARFNSLKASCKALLIQRSSQVVSFCKRRAVNTKDAVVWAWRTTKAFVGLTWAVAKATVSSSKSPTSDAVRAASKIPEPPAGPIILKDVDPGGHDVD